MEGNGDQQQLSVQRLGQVCLDLYDRNMVQEARERTLANIMSEFRLQVLLDNA